MSPAFRCREAGPFASTVSRRWQELSGIHANLDDTLADEDLAELHFLALKNNSDIEAKGAELFST